MARPLVRRAHSTAEALRSSFHRADDQREEAYTEHRAGERDGGSRIESQPLPPDFGFLSPHSYEGWD